MAALSQAAIDKLLEQLAQCPWLPGRLIGRIKEPQGLDVTVGTSVTRVRHPLGSVPRLVLIGAPNVQAAVWQPSPATSSELVLQASVACTVHILVL